MISYSVRANFLGFHVFSMLCLFRVMLPGCYAQSFYMFFSLSWRLVFVPLSVLTCSPCRVLPASAWLCAQAAAGRSRTGTTCWPWTNSGTCVVSSAVSANSTWSRSSPASARTAASTAKRTTTGRRARRAWSSTGMEKVLLFSHDSILDFRAKYVSDYL